MRLLVCLLMLWRVAANAQEHTFEVKKAAKSSNLLVVPQYKVSKGTGINNNIILLDSIPPVGTLVTLWSDKVKLVSYNLVYTSPANNLVKPERGQPAIVIDERTHNVFKAGLAKGCLLWLTVQQVLINNKVVKVEWTYLVTLYD